MVERRRGGAAAFLALCALPAVSLSLLGNPGARIAGLAATVLLFAVAVSRTVEPDARFSRGDARNRRSGPHSEISGPPLA